MHRAESVVHDSRELKEKDHTRSALRMNGYYWIPRLDLRVGHLKQLDHVEKEVEEKLVDKEFEEETINVDPKKMRKRYTVVIRIIKGYI